MKALIGQIWRFLKQGRIRGPHLKIDRVDAPGYKGEYTGREKLIVHRDDCPWIGPDVPGIIRLCLCGAIARNRAARENLTIILPVDVVVVTAGVDYDAIYQARRAMESVKEFWMDSFGIAVLPNVRGRNHGGTDSSARFEHYYESCGASPGLYVYPQDRVGKDSLFLGEAFIIDGYATVAGQSQSDEGLLLIFNHEMYHLVARDAGHYPETFVSTRINPDNTAFNAAQRIVLRLGAAKLAGIRGPDFDN